MKKKFVRLKKTSVKVRLTLGKSFVWEVVERGKTGEPAMFVRIDWPDPPK